MEQKAVGSFKTNAVLVIRWIAALPLAVAAAYLAWVVAKGLNWVNLAMVGINPDSFVSRLFMEAVAGGLMGAAFVYGGARSSTSGF